MHPSKRITLLEKTLGLGWQFTSPQKNKIIDATAFLQLHSPAAGFFLLFRVPGRGRCFGPRLVKAETPDERISINMKKTSIFYPSGRRSYTNQSPVNWNIYLFKTANAGHFVHIQFFSISISVPLKISEACRNS